MPLYMDHHKNVEGLTAEAVAEAHQKDLEIQDKHGAKALKYWFNEEKGEVFCLFEAPSAEAAEAVHREAHGLDECCVVGEYRFMVKERARAHGLWPSDSRPLADSHQPSVPRRAPLAR